MKPHQTGSKDRSNIANARVAGMQTSLKMSNYQVELGRLVGSVFCSDTCLFLQYSIALTMTYV